jgi:hypothetical protein
LDETLLRAVFSYLQDTYTGKCNINIPYDLRHPEQMIAPNSSDSCQASVGVDQAESSDTNLYSMQGPSSEKDLDNYGSPKQSGLTAFLKRHLGADFSTKVESYLKDRHLRPVEVYNAAAIDRKLFSKIMVDKHYHPSKGTAVRLALGLKLNYEQTQDLLNSAGYTLSHGILQDVIVEYCVRMGYHDLATVNELLSQFSVHRLFY